MLFILDQMEVALEDHDNHEDNSNDDNDDDDDDDDDDEYEQDLREATHDDAVRVLKNTGGQVAFLKKISK